MNRKFSPIRLKGAPRRRRNNRLLLGFAGIMFFLLAAATALSIAPAVFPGFGADTADALRAVVGPKPVAELESLSFALQDAINRFRSAQSGGKPEISWNTQGQNGTAVVQSSSAASKSSPRSAPVAVNAIAPSAPADPSASSLASSAPSGAVPMTSTGTQLNWQTYGPAQNGAPLMQRAMVLLDPNRSYTGVALVSMDLTRLQLHIMPGSIEPAHPSLISQVIPTAGMIPPADQGALVAAFNGGFKAIHGHFGMMVNGLTLLPAISDLGTVAVYKDGHVAMGTWGQDITLTPDMVAYRQNCPPLIQAGAVNPALYQDNRTPWGYTNNSDITWRTGLGLTQDGNTLIYAVGNGTSAASLAEALQQAGAYSAMQLDINQYYAHFDTYAPVAGGPDSQGFAIEGQRLLEQMINNPHLYLTSNVRDFFYLTLRGSG